MIGIDATVIAQYNSIEIGVMDTKATSTVLVEIGFKLSWAAYNCEHWYMLMVFMCTICAYEHGDVCMGVCFVPPIVLYPSYSIYIMYRYFITMKYDYIYVLYSM